LTVGGNTPFRNKAQGFITEIKIESLDPRNFNGSDSDYIFIKFDDGYTIEIKTSEYMVVYKDDDQ